MPLETGGNLTAAMDGLDLRNINVRLITNGKRGRQAFGEMSFTKFGVTGPVILTLSGEVVDEDGLAELMDDIQKWGSELAENPSPGNILEYKKRISLFLRSLLSASIVVDETVGRQRKGKKPKYSLIRVVNQKLDQLAMAILQNQKDKFAILAKTNELHGLLVDLLS